MARIAILAQDQISFEDLREALRDSFEIVALNEAPQIVILNLNENIASAAEAIRNLRQSVDTSQCGIIAISEPLSVLSEEILFHAGIDVLLPRPFPIRSLEFRVLALFNRMEGHSEVLKAGPLELNVALNTVTIHGVHRTLTPKQVQILKCLILNKGNLTTREMIKNRVWPDEDLSLRSIDAHISKMKKALPELEGLLLKIYGRGYRLALHATAA